jgi:PHP family Zn ribbon phosphoesterase
MEIIAEMLGVGVESKKVQVKYFGILERLGNELHVLLNAPIEQIEAECGEEIAGAVRNMRNKDIKVEPGYDGEYGRIKLFPQKKREELKTRAQITLF